MNMSFGRNLKTVRFLGSAAVILGLCVPLASAQERRDWDRDRDRDRDWRMTRIEPGTVIPVRTNQSIDVERRDDRYYTGIVDQDVRGENGRLAIPRGSTVELAVRVAPDNDLILDLESVNVNGQRYAIRAQPDRVEARRDNSLVGSIVGAIEGGQVRGRAVRVPRDTVLTFRIERPMEMGVVRENRDRQ
jgi:hypothetical protein